MILLVFNGRSFGQLFRFDLTSFADKIYQWREALERRNLDNATPFTEWSPAIFEEFELT